MWESEDDDVFISYHDSVNDDSCSSDDFEDANDDSGISQESNQSTTPSVEELLEDAIEFNRAHPRPPPLPGYNFDNYVQRRSARNTTAPQNYAVYHRTGRK